MDDTIALIRSYARWWAAPDPYQVTGDDLREIFKEAHCQQIPSSTDADWSAEHLEWGCRIGHQTKEWCGIFAAAVLNLAGVKCHWSLMTGKIIPKDQSQLEFRWGHLDEIQPGDVAVIPRAQHHFLIMDNLWDWDGNPLLVTVEGNTTGQKIKSNSRPLHDNRPHERIYGFYHVTR